VSRAERHSSRSAGSAAGTGLVLLLIAGCASWRAYDPALTLHAGQSLPYQIRATRADSSRLMLTDPFVRSDSLYGRSRGDTLGMALADITLLERSRFSVSRTAALVVGVPLVGLGLTYVILCEIGDCEPVYGIQ
jgi:hypothetical protein